jgi:bifunctional DNA-binding transcriptional regulator/antitoxin component of YhaV-PrlF toxin-antitoxin module
MRKALNLKAGDKVDLKLDGQRLILQRVLPKRAKLKRGRFGRTVLVAPKGAPPMTTESVIALLEELP